MININWQLVLKPQIHMMNLQLIPSRRH